MIQKIKAILSNVMNRLMILVIILFIATVTFLRSETNRINEISDEYMTIHTRNAWMIGCAQGSSGQFAYCKELANLMDFRKLRIDLEALQK